MGSRPYYLNNCQIIKPSNMKNTYCLFVLLSLLCSCGSSNESPYEYNPPIFSHEYEAEIKPLNRDILLGNVFDMRLCDSVMILCAENTDNDNVFQVISTSGEFKLGFAHIGRSDSELVSYEQIAVDPKNRTMYVGSYRGKMLHIDLAKAVVGDRQFVKNGFSLSGNRSKAIHSIGGGRLLHAESMPRFFITDTYACDTTAKYNAFPTVTRHIDGDTTTQKMYFKYDATSAAHPNGKKFVSTTYSGMLLEIFDIGKDKIKPTVVRRFHRPEIEGFYYGTEDCIMGGSILSVTDKYIYTNYYGVSRREVDQGAIPCIAVFDWKGNEVCLYKLREKIRNFAVSPDDKRLYCWAVDSNAEEYLGYMDLIH